MGGMGRGGNMRVQMEGGTRVKHALDRARINSNT